MNVYYILSKKIMTCFGFLSTNFHTKINHMDTFQFDHDQMEANGCIEKNTKKKHFFLVSYLKKSSDRMVSQFRFYFSYVFFNSRDHSKYKYLKNLQDNLLVFCLEKKLCAIPSAYIELPIN